MCPVRDEHVALCLYSLRGLGVARGALAVVLMGCTLPTALSFRILAVDRCAVCESPESAKVLIAIHLSNMLGNGMLPELLSMFASLLCYLFVKVLLLEGCECAFSRKTPHTFRSLIASNFAITIID